MLSRIYGVEIHAKEADLFYFVPYFEKKNVAANYYVNTTLILIPLKEWKNNSWCVGYAYKKC